MRDFGGYSFGYSARDMQEEMTEREASSVILDIANKGADYVAIANAFEHIGAEFVAYLADLQAHHFNQAETLRAFYELGRLFVC